MNAKEEGIVSTLKKIPEATGEAAKKAINDGMIEHAFSAMTLTTIAAEAAEIIEKQDAELTVLRTQPAICSLNPSDIGRRIFISESVPQEHIIIAELSSKYLITPTPIRESELLANVRLIDRAQAVFIDYAQHTVFNA
ncbi:hypothetical protein [Citrobacter sp. TSA-1]|uniref:hypothetical protein n=1 Tax=Citrobacter sp. TSA-1 TaxID=184912 RepID=UPI000BAE196B|nr:hypothetical protein [Citrobacter sp. TSA-1]PAX78144.1 hypothetical protein CIK43_19130 [Citrobacter sp. TSA-1]QKE19518.1 hypothetical protein HF677_007485 [Citrobacter sp. TSA-1]